MRLEMRSQAFLSFNFPLHAAIILLYSLGFASIVVNGNNTDQQALLYFKARITGDSLGIMHSWNESVHFCQWLGVTCSRRHQRVTRLELQNLKLMGSISPYIGNLSFLRVLDLYSNGFSQGIPQEISRLHRLQVLTLSENFIGGEIPSNISGCSKLRYLYIASNLLVGEIPATLGRLSNLKELGLGNNSLSGSIPPFLRNLTYLEKIYLALKRFTGVIPETVGQLKNITILAIPLNEVSGTVPSSIFNLSNIKLLDLGTNNLHGSLPSQLGVNMPYLETFFVSFNQLSGPFPLSLTNASNLIKLQVVGNKFTGNISSFGKLEKLEILNIAGNLLGSQGANDLNFLCSLTNATGLKFLDIGYNRFGGILPKCIGNLSTAITRFVMQDNSILGSIPAKIGNLINLEILAIGENQFSGSIPFAIGGLQKLQLLYVNANSISGGIPTSLGNLKMLTKLHLNDNNLQGNIPPSLGKCENLVVLDLSNNNLSGSIPPQIAGLLSLSIGLDLSSNRLTGVLPSEVGNLRNLGLLDVSYNMLLGVIPTSIGDCIVLGILSMRTNFFQGSIPSSLHSLRGLTYLDISSNNLTGEIPQFLVTFGALNYLDLSYNDLEGIVPVNGVFKNVSIVFLEGNSKLCGGTPEFHLPTCDNLKDRGRSTISVKLIIAIISALSGVILFAFFVILSLLRKKRKHPTSSDVENPFLELSYQMILKATNGFSAANLVGKGSFGFVYKGILEENRIVIAVKVLNLLSRGASRSFMAECEALRNIRHRNLVKVLTTISGVDYQGNDFKALVYEFMQNGSLEEWLYPSDGIKETEARAKSLNLFQRLNVAVDVGCALEYLHHHCGTPIVHCDLKPSNILLDDEIVGHVGDFGLAKFITSNLEENNTSSLSSSVGLRGTIGYAPPEYGMGSVVTTYGDVYSFGILILQMLTGRRPTDEMFKENMNLHNFVKTALPNRVAEITDPILYQQGLREAVINSPHNTGGIQRDGRFLQCLTSVFEIGVACSVEMPMERMNMATAVAELCSIRSKLLPTRLLRTRGTS